MIHYILGGSGTGKSTQIISNIKNQIEKGLSPLIIIPDQFSFEFDKKLYRNLGLKKYNRTDALSFARLAEFIFLQYGGKSGEYANDLTKTAVMYQTIEELQKTKSFKFFNKQSEKNNFPEFALKITEELKKANVSAQMLYEKTINIQNNITKDKAEDIALIYTIYDGILEKNNLKDKLNDISEASEIAALNGFFKNKTVFIDEFDGFSGDEMRMLEVIISQAEDIFISLRTDNLNPDLSVENNIHNLSLFSSASYTYYTICEFSKKYNRKYENIFFNNQYRFKSDAIQHICKNIFRNEKFSTDNLCKNTDGFKIIEARDFYQEAEFICSEICRLVKDENYSFNDIAIISRSPEDYSGILDACFKRYNIPFFMDIEQSVMHTSVMLLISGVLEIISTNKPDTETILKYAKTQLIGMNYEQISALENYCYKWNIQGYSWNSPFTADIENNPSVETTREKLISPLISLRKKCLNTTGFNICTAIYEYLEEMQIPTNISGLAEDYRKKGYEYMSGELKRLWGCLMDMLDVLANILHDTPVTPAKFSSLLNSMLKQNKYSNPPHSLDAVSVSDAQRARLNEPKIVFVIGVNEGFFPAVITSESLFSENDKDILSQNGIRLSKTISELIANEKFIFYKTVSAPSEKLYISYPLSDAKGNSRFASNILQKIQKLFSVNTLHFASEFNLTFYSPTTESAYYNYVQHFNKTSSDICDIENVLRKSPLYMDKINFLKAINQNQDFQIENTSLIRKALSSHFNISATKFENYNLCHFKFFCHDILKVYSRNKKEINPLETGNIIHLCLENVFSSCKSKDEFNSLSKENILVIISESMNTYRETYLGGNVAKSARFEANYSKIKNTAYEIVVHIQEELSQSEFRPVDYELQISEITPHSNAPVKIITPNGIEVILSGKIDRVDLFEKDNQKYIRIIDYKSGNKEFSLGNLLYGIDMQMFLYLFSVIAETGKYKNHTPAGVLYLPYSNAKCLEKFGANVSVSEIRNKNYKMKGVVLQNRTVLTAMEKDIQGVYIPAAITAKDKGKGEILLNSKSSSYLNENQFRNLEKFIRELISEMTDSLYDGNISANPFFKGKDNSTCTYCDYNEICGNAWELRSRQPEPDSDKLIKQLLDEDEKV